jgi:hypothetical protein
MKSKWKSSQRRGSEDILTDDQRKDLLEERLIQINCTIDRYSSLHISSQTIAQVDDAIRILHQQNLLLLKTSDEEQLVDR